MSEGARHIRWLSTLLSIAASSPATAAALPEPITNPHTDEVLHSACAPLEFARLRDATLTLAADRNPAQAWLVASTVLCGRGADASRLIRRHTPELVATDEYSVGELIAPVVRLRPRSVVEPLAGEAFGATVQADGPDLLFNHQPSGVCAAGFRLRYVHAAWLIVDTGIACD